MNFIFDYRGSDSPYVELVWRTQSLAAGTFISQAATQWEMVITRYNGRTDITVRGPETKASPADTPSDAEFFGILFRPGVFMPHLPFIRLVDNALTLPDATGRSFWFNGAVWKLPDFDNADTFVRRLMRDGLLQQDHDVAAVLRGETVALSPRALQYRFLRATGLTQSIYHQIQRARQAAAALEQGVPILDAMLDVGYFDQAHMTRSLKRFIGRTPKQIMLNTARDLIREWPE